MKPYPLKLHPDDAKTLLILMRDMERTFYWSKITPGRAA